MQLILREQQTPTAAFDALYGGFMGRVAGLGRIDDDPIVCHLHARRAITR